MKLEVFFMLITFIKCKAVLNHNPVKPGCPVLIKPKENLTLDWITGSWYEIKRLSTPFERGTCISVNIGLNIGRNGSMVSIRHHHKVNGKFKDFDQNATVSKIRSIWSFKYDGSVGTEIDGNMYVLETNYVQFMVVYACGTVNRKKETEMVWILSRQSTLQPEYLNMSLEALKVSKIVTKPLIDSNQNNCSIESVTAKSV